MQSLSESLAKLKLSAKSLWHEQLLYGWRDIMGPFAQHARLERVQEHAIVVGVYDPRWLAELHTSNGLLLERMRQALPAIPQDIKIVCIWARPIVRPVRACREQAVEEQVGLLTLTDEQDQALMRVVDPEMRNSLADYWQRCGRERARYGA